MPLERMLRKLGRGIITAGLVASLSLSCSEDALEPSPSPEPIQIVKNNPPSFISTPVTSVEEKQSYSYQSKAQDADGDNLIYSSVKKPNWISLSSSGLISGTAPEVSDNENQEINIAVSDGKDSAYQNYILTVKNLSNIYVLDNNQIDKLFQVNEDNLVFSQSVNFLPGDIIGSDITTKTPDGFLREINSVSADKKTLYTSQATLEQVVKDASLSYSGKLLPSQIVSSSSLKGVQVPPSSVAGFDFNIPIKNAVLYDFDGDSSTTSDQLVVNGNISFNNNVDLSIKINDHKIDDINFKNSTSINSDISVGFNSIGLARTYQVKIAEYKFKPFVIAYLPTVVPIPVIVSPKLSVSVTIDPTLLNPLSGRVQDNASLDIGLHYNGTWNPSAIFSNDFTFSNPVLNKNLELKVSAGPSLEMMLYGVAGPFAGISGRLRLKSENGGWELYGGLGASLGVKMEVLKKGLSAQFKEAINYETLLAKSASPTLEGKILFCTTRNNDAEIYSMNPEGLNEVNLTSDPAGWDTNPSWSPDGKKILYSSRTTSSRDYAIHIMNSDGSNKTRLTSSSMTEANPVFSPDGEKIAYAAAEVVGYEQIYIMNKNGSSPVKITDDNAHYYWDVAWMPSSKIVCASNRDNVKGEIYTMNPDGTGIKRLTNNSYYDRFPSWSPDGTKIAFTTNKDGNEEVYVMNADGSNQINISNSSSTSDYNPFWSPDGKKIVYVNNPGIYSPSAEIWIMNSDGSNKTRITNNNYDDDSPSWSPK
jgi:TolB protein